MLRVILAKELEETADERLVFRRNSTATKLATALFRIIGKVSTGAKGHAPPRTTGPL